MGAFVVHLHAARRRHFDLRLQVGPTLKSFAVPKGPSLDPSDKRLAVNTEDHPLEYLEFEDIIPAGNYGAGAMIVWDRGRVEYLERPAEESFGRGKVDFVLSGYKLRGRFALVHTGDRAGRADSDRNQWLLIKKTDAYSTGDRDSSSDDPRSVLSGLTVEELEDRVIISDRLVNEAQRLGAGDGRVDARHLHPMLCATSNVSLDDPERLYELKLDGVRIVAERRGDEVTLRYRTLRNATVSYPEVARAIRTLPVASLVLDGEIVAFDDAGRPSFQRLGRRIGATRPHDAALFASEVPVQYLVFDLLELGGKTLLDVPLIERKRLLARLLPGRGVLRALDHLEGNGHALYDFCRARKLEGLVVKRARSRYRPGPRRSDDWIKLKCEREDDFAVVGWVEGKGGRKRLGSLELATYDGERFVLRSRVGSGLDEHSIDELLEMLRPLEAKAPTAAGKLPRTGGLRHFVEPRIVVSVQHMGWTDDGGIRHPVFRGVRPDMRPTACVAAPPAELLERQIASTDTKNKRKLTVPSPAATRVAVTNRAKVFWPDEGYTKGDLADYYAAISDVMLPFLRDRPVVLVRYPDGITGKSFFQWNVPRGTPEWIRTLALFDDESGERKNTFLIDDRDGLVYLANLGCIVVHILACRAGALEECDFLTLDFDVGERSFQDAVTLALSLRSLLDEIGLPGFPKTSGQSGLHVLVPVGPGVPFDTAKLLVELIGRLVQAHHPDLATLERRVSKRGQRVYIDTGQTGRSRTIVAPYSVRAAPGATVSMPLYWDEVHRALDPRQFSMFTAVERVHQKGDPMTGLLSARPDIGAVVAELEARIER